MIPDAVDGSLRVAVVAHSERQRRYLAEVLEPNGVQVVADEVLRGSLPDRVDEVADVLLVDLQEDADGDLDLDELIEHVSLPMLFNDGDASKMLKPKSIAGRAWGRRLAEKLTALAQQEAAPAARSASPALKLVSRSNAGPDAPLAAHDPVPADNESQAQKHDAAPQPEASVPADPVETNEVDSASSIDWSLEELELGLDVPEPASVSAEQPSPEPAAPTTESENGLGSIEWSLEDVDFGSEAGGSVAPVIATSTSGDDQSDSMPGLDFVLDEVPSLSDGHQHERALGTPSSEHADATQDELPNTFDFDTIPTLSDDFTLGEALGFEADADQGASDPLALDDLPELSEALTLGEAVEPHGEDGLIPSAEAEFIELGDLAAIDDQAVDGDLNLGDLSAFADEIEAADLPWLAGERAGAAAAATLDEPAAAGSPPAETPANMPVWVLGASIGGPQAVKEFIAQLPADTPAAFVVAQHIGTGFVDLLASQLDRVTAMEVRSAQAGMGLRPGQIVVAPVEQRLVFADGVIELHPDRRKSVYSPSIDDVMSETAKAFGPRANAIVFSGMGNDGVEGARAIVAAGGTVWCQEASSCVISSMADSAREAGVVSETGAPSELARRLLTKLNGELA